MMPLLHVSVVAALCALAGLGCQRSKEAAPEAQVTSSAQPGELELPTELSVDPSLLESGRIALATAASPLAADARSAPGEVVSSPEGEAEVGVLVMGRVDELKADVGDTVKKGQVLAWVRSPEVGAARAEMARSASRRDLEKSRLARQETLQKDGATTQAAVDAAQAAFRAAEVDHSAAAYRLSALGAPSGSGARFALTSPIDGVITERDVKLGAAIRADEMLFRVVAPTQVLIVARYREGGEGVPPAGTQVDVSLRGAEQRQACRAIVETSSDVVDPRTRTILARLKPVGECPGLRPGAYVEVHRSDGAATRAVAPAASAAAGAPSASPVGSAAMPDTPMADAPIQLPAEAVVYVRGRETVFVKGSAPGQFLARRVHVESMDGRVAYVSEGVAAGEQVVVKGTILLKGEMLRDVLGGE